MSHPSALQDASLVLRLRVRQNARVVCHVVKVPSLPLLPSAQSTHAGRVELEISVHYACLLSARTGYQLGQEALPGEKRSELSRWRYSLFCTSAKHVCRGITQ